MEEKRLNEKEEVDLSDYLKVMGKRKWTIIITFLACILFSLLLTFLQKPVYRIKSAFEIGSITAGSRLGLRATMTPEATASLCKSDYLLNKVKEILGLPKKEEIKIKAESKPDSPMVAISLESSLPEKAVKIVSTITDLIVKEQNSLYEKKISSLKEEVKGIQKQIELSRRSGKNKNEVLTSSLYLNQLQIRFNEIQERITSFRETRVIFPATIPERPIKPRPAFNLAVSIILGGFLGIFLAFFQEYLSKFNE
ncbi:MAG: hypothetical protein KAX20_01595 [Candidatus Omnitrophica bacterium]|nr:hypothetical protein [Candidatus Omnitrophota bacterium]